MGAPMEHENYRLYPSTRLLMSSIALLVGTALSAGFASFNFAIVCMVNETAIALDSDGNQSGYDYGPCQAVGDEEGHSGGYNGEFAWDKATQASLFAANAFGSLFGNIPSGILADRYGSKILFIICLTVNCIVSALTPLAAYGGVAWLFAARVIQGASLGASWAPLLAMVSTWGSRSETGSLVTFSAVGYQFGPLLAMATSSVICGSRFRWPFIFYLWSAFSFLTGIICLIFFTDDPKRSRFISDRELAYIQSSSMKSTGPARPSLRMTPWRKLLTTPSAISVYVCHFCSMWAILYVSAYLPTYSKEVLHQDVGSNGFTSTLPAVAQCVMRLASGLISDRINFCGRSKTFSVKVFTAFCMLVPCLVFLILGFLDCRHTALAIVCFTVAGGFLCTSTASYLRGAVLMASRYAGAIGAMANVVAYVAAVIMPYLVGALTKHGLVAEWQHTAFVASGVCMFGFVVYEIFGTAEEQKWAMGNNDNKIYAIKEDSLKIKF